MMIFVEEHDDVLTKALEEATKFTYGSKMFTVNSEADIIKVQPIIKNLSKGAVLLGKQFGRGVNLRFAVDAEVLVLINKDYIGEPLVHQMIGRSSRRQGLCHGKVFITTEFEDLQDSQTGALDFLTSREDNYAEDDGQMIVRELFNKVTMLKSELKMSLVALKGKTPKWRTTREDFATVKKVVKTQLLKFLKQADHVPAENW
jgi:hypothetical protein